MGTAIKAKPAEPTEKKQENASKKRYRCVMKCQYDCQLWYEGDILETDAGNVPDVFELIKE